MENKEKLKKGSEITLDGQHLYSPRFDDRYASNVDPADEKRFVFCTGNSLENRFKNATRFTIGELGFGAGISFLSTLELWQQLAPPGARLNYISTEMYPLTFHELSSALSAYPSFLPFSKLLLEQWSDPVPGFHRIEFTELSASLTIIIDDVLPALKQLDAEVDAWYLDGFSPAKNPEMWRPEIFKIMRGLSHANTTFATYTATGQVRRALQQEGFDVIKSPGYARKRERLTGKVAEAKHQTQSRTQKPWFTRPAIREKAVKRVAVIGGGLAGCSCANRLAARGLQVSVYEQGDAIASGTSHNPAAIIHPYLSTDANIATRFSVQGYLYTLNKIRQLANRHLDCGFHATGLISKPKNAAELTRKNTIAKSNRYPRSLLNYDFSKGDSGIINFPESGWVDMAKLCVALIQEYENNIFPQLSTHVESLTRDGKFWHINATNSNTQDAYDAVIITSGHRSQDILQTQGFEVTPNKGQLTEFSTATTPASSINQNGYLIPYSEKSVYVGSSYLTHCDVAENSAEENSSNLEKLGSIAPELTGKAQPSVLNAWSGIRATTEDRLPLAGAVVNLPGFIEQYAGIIQGEKRKTYDLPPYEQGLYLCTGLGSRAMTYGLISAELVASLCCDEALPVEKSIYHAVHPARFITRHIMRGSLATEKRGPKEHP